MRSTHTLIAVLFGFVTPLTGVEAQVSSGGPSSGQQRYVVRVIEPFDTSYSLASSRLGDLNHRGVGTGIAYGGGPFFWTLGDGKVAADIAGDEINDSGITAGGGAIFWAPGNYEQIPHPYGSGSVHVRGLNNENVVCGSAGLLERSIAFVWFPGRGSFALDDLGVPGPTWRAYDINDRGEVIGTTSLAGEPFDERAFLFDLGSGETVDLHRILNSRGQGASRVADINERGAVVGEGSYDDDRGVAGFVWSPLHGVTRLPGIGGGLEMDVHPASINDSQRVVGAALDGNWDWRAFLWTRQDGIQDLESLAEFPAGFNVEGADVINNHGWIAGHGFWGSAWGPDRAFVMVPVDADPIR